MFGAPEIVGPDQYTGRMLDLRASVGWFVALCDPGDECGLSRFYAADALTKWNDAL